MSGPAFVFEVERVEETLDEGEHRAVMHGALSEGNCAELAEVARGTPVLVPSREGRPLAARVAALRGDAELVLHRPVPLRRLISPGVVEPCGEATYDATLLRMLTDDRVRAVMHDRPTAADHGDPEAFAPPACECLEVLRGRAAAVDVLRAMLRSWEPENVSGAVQGLALFDADTAVPLLARMLRHNVARVRYRTAVALAAHADREDVAAALRALGTDPDPRLRRLGSRLLAQS